MNDHIEIGGMIVYVQQKPIKHVHLSVYPPNGDVRISIPEHMNEQHVRAFVSTKLSWIKKEQKKMLQQDRETQRLYVSGESHYLWGKRYLLKVVEGKKDIWIAGNKIIFVCPKGVSTQYKRDAFACWQRKMVRTEIEKILPHWEITLNVCVNDLIIRSMRTRWGSCTHKNAIIRLNTELVKKPKECLEYVLVHELIHIKHPNHKREFQNEIQRMLPKWKTTRSLLNSLPL
jgi:predicted metal-dependent hydrolase